jgi:hypothetical protein
LKRTALSQPRDPHGAKVEHACCVVGSQKGTRRSMKPERRNLMLALVAAASVALSLAACGNSMDVVDTGGCSSSSGQALAAGKYTQPGVGSATNVLVLLSNGAWCADAMSDGGTALTSEGTWSAQMDDGGTGVLVTKTNSLYFNVVACDGQTVKSYRRSDGLFAGFSYVRESQSTFTCNGQ